MAITMNAFEAVAVITAMPTVAADLNGDSLYGAAFSAYMLASLVSLIWSGESADRRGPFPPFLAGVASFALGLVLAGLAPNMGVLVLGRSCKAPARARWRVCPMWRSGVWPSEARPKMFAALSAAWVVLSLVAPLAGFVTHISAGAVFLGLLPLLPILLALAGRRSLVCTRRRHRRGAARLGDAFLLAAAVGVMP
jgi:MFS family permease